MIRNLFLQEAVDKTFNPATYITAYKRQMNSCKLTKFRSVGECSKFYSGFFLCQVEDGGNELTFQNWTSIYNALLVDDKFCNDMVTFIAMYQPAEFTGMFVPLINLIDSELRHMQKYRLRYLSDAKAFFTMFQQKMDSIGNTIKAQINDPSTLKFIITINGMLTTHITYINRLMEHEMKVDTSADDITLVVSTPISEDVKEILDLLENYNQSIQQFMEPINEAVINNAKMKAKEIYIKEQKASRAFDEFIMKKVKAAREKRRNRKHAEMVGEALRINNELKRLMKSLAVGAFSPTLGVILWVTSVVVDRATDKRDRDILVGQIKDELEIVDEKIQMAERNGDDKAKIELIRIRQRLQKEYERIMRYKWDPNKHR